LSRGECEVLIKEVESGFYVEKVLKSGAIFGEIGLLARCTRTATIRSLNYCTCATLSRDHFNEMCKIFPETLNKMKKKMFSYSDKWKQFVKTMIQQVAFF